MKLRHMLKKLSNLRIQDAANYLNVSTKTLRRWEARGKLVPRRSKGQQRYYSKKQLEEFLIISKQTDKNSEKYLSPKNIFNRDIHPSKISGGKFWILGSSLVTLLLFFSFYQVANYSKQNNSPLNLRPNNKSTDSTQNVLAATTGLDDEVSQKYTFNVNVPAKFNDVVTFSKNITAPNIVTSVNNKTGDIDLELVAGSGITVDGLTVTNTDKGSDQKIFKTIKVGSTSFDADGNTSTLEFTSSGGVTLSLDTTNKKLNINSAAPDYSLSGWTDNGTTVTLTDITDSVEVGALTADTLTVNGATIIGGNLTVGNGVMILPDTDLGSDLGSTSKRFNNLWVANINSNSSQSFAGQTTFSYPPTNSTITQASVLINPTTSAADGQLLGLGIAGYQRALIDEDGDLTIGYTDATSAPASDYPLNIYGHNGTRVSFINTSGNSYFAGNVGIGTTSPTEKLHIVGGGLRVSSFINSEGNYRLSSVGAMGYSGTEMQLGNGSYWQSLSLYTNAGRFLTGTSAGNVGIGTTSPEASLHIKNITAGGANGLTIQQSGGTDLFSVNSYGNVTANGSYRSTTNGFLANRGSGFAIGGMSNVGFFPCFANTDSKIVNYRNLYFDTYTDSSYNTKLTLLQNGNVGIGTTTPSQKIDVSDGNINFSGGAPGGLFWSNNADKSIKFSGNNMVLSAFDIQLKNWDGAAYTEHVRITGAGNVGIGTTNPQYRLDLVGSGAEAIRIDAASNATLILDKGAEDKGSIVSFNTSGTQKWVIGSTDSDAMGNGDEFYIGLNAGDSKIFVERDGNVGIGTTSPDSQLTLGGYGSIEMDTGNQNAYISHIYDSGASLNDVLSIATNFKRTSLATGTISRTSDRTAEILFRTDSDIGDIQFGTGDINTAPTTKLIIKNSGNVGIGTTSPSSPLHIVSSSDSLKFQTSDNTWMFIDWLNSTGSRQAWTGLNADLSAYQIHVQGSANYIILDGGNVGIGTTAPSYLLDVAGNSRVYKSINDDISLAIQNTYGTGTAPTATLGLFPGATSVNGPAISGYRIGDFSSSGTRTAGLKFYTLNANAAVTAMTINQSGNVGIGTTAPNSRLTVVDQGTSNAYSGTLNVYASSMDAGVSIGYAGISKIHPNSNSDLYINSKGTGNLLLQTQATGNVGIGTTSPQSILNIKATNAATVLRLDNAGGWQSHIEFYPSEVNSENWRIKSAPSGFSVENITDSSASRLLINNNGNVGIGTTSPSTKLEIGSSDLGDGIAGPTITLGRNNNATNAGAGSINFLDKDGDSGYVWQDASGILRIHTAAPTTANDTAGTVVGAQSSSLASKNVLGEFVDNTLALNTILDTPLFRFNYKSGAFNGEEFTGIITDYSPTFGMDNEKSLNIINGLGYTFGAIKELNTKIDSIQYGSSDSEQPQNGTFLDIEVLGKLEVNGTVTFKSEVEFQNSVFFKFMAKFTEIFADKTHQKELCVGDEGNETCITKEKLDEIIKLIPTPTATPVANDYINEPITDQLDASPSANPSTPATPSIDPISTSSAMPTTNP